MSVTLKLLFLAVWIVPLLYLAYRARGRSLFDAGALAGLIALYVVQYRAFVLGREFVFHDTMWAHHGLYAVVGDWLASGFPIGWNSFLNGGEPLYVLSNYFLWAELVAFVALNTLTGIPAHELVNLYFTYVLLSFAVGCFCLFSAVLRERVLVFYALVPVLFGGLTPSTFGQYVLSPLYFVPVALLCAYRAVSRRSLVALGWLAFFVAVSMNHYLPHYLALSAGILLSSAAAVTWFRRRPAGEPAAEPERRPRSLVRVAAIAMLCVAAAAPAVFVYRELGGWVAPTRGNVELGQYGQGQQPGVNLTPGQYRFLVDLPRIDPAATSWDRLEYHHSVFFVGWIPVLLALYSLFGIRDRRYQPWLLSLVLLGLLALGQPADLWATMRAHVPLFHLRHLYPLALTITLLVVMLSAFGLARLPGPRLAKTAVAGLTLAASLVATAGDVWADGRYREPFAIAPYRAPVERALYSRRLGTVPLDVEPVASKRAAATHHRDDFVLVRSGAYHRVLADGLPILAGPMFGHASGLGWSAPAIDRLPNALANGSVEAWSVTRDGARRQPDAITVAWQGARGEVHENRETRSVRSGAASARVDLPGGGRVRLAWDLPAVGGPDAEFAVVGACLKGGDRVSVEAELEWRNLAPVPVEAARRIPRDDVESISVLHQHRTSGGWECFRRVVGLRGPAGGLHLSVWLAAERRATVYVDDLELRPVSAGAFGGPAPIPVQYIRADDPDHLVVRVTMPDDGYLVRRENVHPRWRAQVNGRDHPIEPYAGTLQAVRLARGTHTVAWEFSSPYPALLWAHVAAVFVGYAGFALSAVLDGRDAGCGDGVDA